MTATTQAVTGLKTGPRNSFIGSIAEVEAAIWLIAAFTILRLVSIGLVGLGVDETYSLAIARHLHLSYFDHPPMHLWIVHAFSPVLGYGRLARLPFIFLFVGSSWLLFDLTRQLFGSRPALWALLSFNLCGFFTVAASSWVLPDGPLIFFLLMGAVELSRLTFPRNGQASGVTSQTFTWLRIGLWIGLAGLSKYQAVIFGLGVALFLVSTVSGRAWLKQPGPYLASVLAAAVISPVIFWNAQNQWASFVFQGGRATSSHGARPGAVLSALAGQMVLLLPWMFAPLAVAAHGAVRAGPADPRRWLCVTLGVPGVLLFALTPIWGQTALPHWSMPSWLFLLPLCGDLLARSAERHRWPKTFALLVTLLLFALWGLLISDAATGWFGAAWPKTFTKGDPTLETVEWGRLPRSPDVAALLAKPGNFIVSMKWNEAGRIVAAVSDQFPVVVLSNDPRGFADNLSLTPRTGHDALIVVKREDLKDGLGRARKCFEKVEPLQVMTVGRLRRSEMQLYLFAGRRFLPACSQIGDRSPEARSQSAALKAS